VFAEQRVDALIGRALDDLQERGGILCHRIDLEAWPLDWHAQLRLAAVTALRTIQRHGPKAGSTDVAIDAAEKALQSVARGSRTTVPHRRTLDRGVRAAAAAGFQLDDHSPQRAALCAIRAACEAALAPHRPHPNGAVARYTADTLTWTFAAAYYAGGEAALHGRIDWVIAQAEALAAAEAQHALV
jgi:hypothetical protein